jgi:hypothetical protein
MPQHRLRPITGAALALLALTGTPQQLKAEGPTDREICELVTRFGGFVFAGAEMCKGIVDRKGSDSLLQAAIYDAQAQLVLEA